MKEWNKKGISILGKRISLYSMEAAACILFAILLWVPALITTLYTYPVQDDFHYALKAKACMEEGHSLLSMALIQTAQYYKTFSGYYMSTFLMFFFSGIIDCSILGIRVFLFVNCLLFMGALYLFWHTVVVKVMEADRRWSALFFLLITMCLNCVHYFSENENMYWFCSSVIYLSLLTVMLLGVSLFLTALSGKNPRMLAAASLLGFLAAGASLNVTALCCILYLLAALWGIARNRRLYSAIGMGAALAGALINAACPANFARRGSALTVADIWATVQGSIEYLFDRYRSLLGFHTFAAIVIVSILLFAYVEGKSNFRFPLPLLFTLVVGIMPAAVVFPVMLGYSPEIYRIMERSIFISDFAIYLFLLMILLYWRGWIGRRFGSLKLSVKIRRLTAAAAVIVMAVGVRKSVIPYIPVVKMTEDFRNGVYREYSDWVVSIYTQVRESEEEIVTATMPPVDDTTCLVNPKFYIGVYDYEQEYANRTIAEYYGKKALYLLIDEEAENKE